MKITMQDVRDYLATLEPDQIAGEVSEANTCPVALAGEWRYKVMWVITESYCYPSDHPGQGYAPDPEIVQLIKAIDKIRFAGSVSRSEVEGVLP
jgi:hypothetical protein